MPSTHTVVCKKCSTTNVITLGITKNGSGGKKCSNFGCSHNIRIHLDGKGQIKKVD